MDWRTQLLDGVAIPAHPLALTADRRLDERRQRALTRYYLASGVGGIAVGVHTTQFGIREHGVYEPVLQLAWETVGGTPTIMIAGISGSTAQATAEAETAADLGYHIGLVSLASLGEEPIDRYIDHLRAVASVIPIMGFYLQPAVGGPILPQRFWERFLELDNVVGIKIAPFNRYHTVDVVRAVARSGRGAEIALYTGNDDHIIQDLVTPFVFEDSAPVRIVGGLLGQWSVWTSRAVELHRECRDVSNAGSGVPQALLTIAEQLTAANAAIFDVAHGFAGCIPGIHEVLRLQGLLAGTWCLERSECLSIGQAEAIEQISNVYPWLTDDEFVREHLDEWLQ